MYRKLFTISLVFALLQGCASVPTESHTASQQAKRFPEPPYGSAYLYVYRSTPFGQALEKDLWLNDECIGATANNIFFVTEIIGEGATHKLSTESEFSPNHLMFKAESGESYFVEQYIKLGVFVGGADLRIIEADKAKSIIRKLKLGKPGICSRQNL